MFVKWFGLCDYLLIWFYVIGVGIMYFELNIFYCIKIYIKVLEMSLNNLYVIFFKLKIYVILYNM